MRAKALNEAAAKLNQRDQSRAERIARFNEDLGLLKTRNPFAFTSSGSLSLELTGVIWDEKKPMALIGGDVFTVGDRIGDRWVYKIDRDSVQIIDAEGDITVLKIYVEQEQ